ncbi:hypothetical protein BDP81DRAFT_46215 [Colletotrichum phormii]|uniref:Uncharacterized protein n=1 Tax=Colletotrichum phormii TaxID=359342 RepID=A0AAI9ZR45_9PEZI|nr:uncharacterized protein BDP81DRAFT_46215 [Colletotrichum phormii]KAK1635162.1 hypothetical protein BDP81DRAFT_46215 [Colletotrichum phormii]
MESKGVSGNERHGSAAAGKKENGWNPLMDSLLERAASEVGGDGTWKNQPGKNQERIGRRQEGIGPAGASASTWSSAPIHCRVVMSFHRGAKDAETLGWAAQGGCRLAIAASPRHLWSILADYGSGSRRQLLPLLSVTPSLGPSMYEYRPCATGRDVDFGRGKR